MKYTEARIDFFNTLKANDYYKIEKFNNGEYFKDVENPQNEEVLNLIADFTNVDTELLWSQSVSTIKSLYSKIMDQFVKYKPKQPPTEVTIDKTTYTFRTEYLKMSIGWWEHVRVLSEKEANPIDKLGLLYIEKGLDYSQTDKNKNVINPTDERTKLLAEHLTLGEFIDVHNFFFTILETYKKLSEQQKKLLSKKMSKRQLRKMVQDILLN